VGQSLPHRFGQGRRAQSLHQDPSVAVHQAGDGVGQQRRRVDQQAAPVAGVVVARPQIGRQPELEDAPRAQEERRPFGSHARPVGADHDIRLQAVAQGATDPGQLRGTDLLAHLQQQLHVEADPAVARLEHLRERPQIDGVLALVVGRAAAVKPVPALGHPPGGQAVGPAVIHAGDHIAMSIHQHGGKRGVLVALGDQEQVASIGLGPANLR
jgi:hypothetical protein